MEGKQRPLEASLTAGETVGKGSICDLHFRCDCLQDTHIKLAMQLLQFLDSSSSFSCTQQLRFCAFCWRTCFTFKGVCSLVYIAPRLSLRSKDDREKDNNSVPRHTSSAITVSPSYQRSSSVLLSLNSTKGDPGRNAKQSHKSLLEALVINLPYLNSGPFLRVRLGDCTRFLLPRATFVLIGDHENIHDSFH